MEQKIKAYKAFDKDLSCRGFKYEVGKEYEETGDIKACEKGFHACPYPLDVFGYYAPAGSRFCEVEQSGKIDDSESDKVCSSKIRIGAELDIRGLVKAAVSFVKERCTNECNADPGKPATAGYRGAATAGYRGAATAGNSGAATAGDYGAATAGYRGAATAGDRGAATARGKASTGSNGLSVARGNNVQVKGGIGAILVIAEEGEDTCDIVDWKAVLVDGEVVKADTWYRLENGELVEVD
ncbi:hypothetical protein LI048_13805 [Phocaeicola dorei]|uniref:DUF7666 domain-containing protein n=1 Tax=Phocaeicola dorei TaxID=357276 RepID=UPI001D082A5E|nr:hypothetical protein [Phocaeicola dorei]MCB6965284.1 hypothetical protein [Phocaeicola dorei]